MSDDKLNHAVTVRAEYSRTPALITHCDISSAAPAGPAESWHRPGA